jgi:hypothetical protein
MRNPDIERRNRIESAAMPKALSKGTVPFLRPRATKIGTIPGFRPAKFALLLAAVLVPAACGCASYHIGSQGLYPKDVHTVYVPIFESNSFRPELGERLTEAVVKRIEEVTPLKVVNSAAEADSVLMGQISGDVKHVLFRNNFNDPRQIQAELQVKVHWEDRHGNALRNCPPIPVPPEVIAVTGTADLTPEAGQSYATSSQQAIQRIASQIVGMMEAPW